MQFEIGKTYERPCAIVRTDDGREYAIPVFDHLHADPQFGFPHEHYHIDGRFFMEPRMMHRYHLAHGCTNQVIRANDDNPEFVRLALRQVVCIRSATGLTFPEEPNERQADNLKSYERWYASYLGKPCEGKRCPHFGTEMLEKNGLLVCPLHELTADPRTLRIIGRSPAT